MFSATNPLFLILLFPVDTDGFSEFLLISCVSVVFPEISYVTLIFAISIFEGNTKIKTKFSDEFEFLRELLSEM